MLGDWNFVGAEDVRLQDAHEAGGGGDTIARVFDMMFTDFAELVQPFPMYGRRGVIGMSLLSRLDRRNSVSEFEAAGQYWTMAVVGSLLSATTSRSHSALRTRKPGRTARRPRLFRELVRTQEYQDCLARLAVRVEAVGDVAVRYSVNVELAHRPAKQARLLLFRPGLSQPALLAEAAAPSPRLGGTCRP